MEALEGKNRKNEDRLIWRDNGGEFSRTKEDVSLFYLSNINKVSIESYHGEPSECQKENLKDNQRQKIDFMSF